jgi:hypothetical protein
VFLYLARSSSPMDFRVSFCGISSCSTRSGSGRSRALSKVYGPRKGRILGRRSRAPGSAFVTLSQRDELESFFRQPDPAAPDTSAAELCRWRATRRPFRGARFAALRRYWITEGSRSIYLATSPRFTSAARRAGMRRSIGATSCFVCARNGSAHRTRSLNVTERISPDVRSARRIDV